MPSLYKHRQWGWQIRYWVYFLDGTHKIKYKHFKAKSKALLAFQDTERLEVLSSQNKLLPDEILFFIHRKYITQEEARLVSRETVPDILPGDITWETLKKYYLSHIETVGSEMSQFTYPKKLGPILSYFQDKDLLTINEEIIKEFISYQRSIGKKKATINKYLSILRKMLDFLIEKHILRENPARKIKFFKNLDENIPRPLFPDDLKRFFTKLKEFSYFLRGYFAEMMMIYIYTGMRRYELLNLKIEDINIKQGYFIIRRSKNSKGRVIDMNPVLRGIIKSVFHKNKSIKISSNAYFFGGSSKPIVRYEEVTKAFIKFRRKINLPEGVRLHSLRHTFITYLLQSGAPLMTVKEIAGHKRLLTTERYLHLIPQPESPVKKLSFDILKR
jgi:integrase/recombinase XerC